MNPEPESAAEFLFSLLCGAVEWLWDRAAETLRCVGREETVE